MSYSKYYNPTNWENYPSEDTAINAARLNNIEDGVDTLDDRIVELSTDKSEVDWNQMLIAGRKIAEITINGITKDVLAPEGGGGGGGSTVTITPTISTGTKIADYVIDGYGGSLYAPNGGGGASALDDLTDVDLTTPSNGQVLKYDSANSKWINANESGGGASSLNDLNDVTITSATQGQVLKKGASDWENANLSKSDVGLGNVDNTSDANKPVSTATQTAISNAHKVTNKAVDLTSWTTDTTSQSGTTLYKKQITLNHIYSAPSVDVGAASGSVLPTVAEQTAYSLLKYVTYDDTVPCLYLYASDIPSTAFYIDVEGVD